MNVLNDYPTVTTLDNDKLWRMLWQYAAIHTPLWKIINDTDGTYVDIASKCGAGTGDSFPTCCYGGHLPLPPGCNHTGPGGLSCPPPFAYTGCDICRQLPKGTGNFWIAENGCADGHSPSRPYSAGDSGPSWIDSTIEGYEYNHSTFVDLILTALAGLRPGADGKLTVNPLVPPGALPWWTADGIVIRGKIVSVRFDRDGTHYKQGKGLKVWLDGKLAASAPAMAKLQVQL
eukprot:COSAG04_NODE_360_length_15920_cov_50.432815_11_plen_231_part_00